MQSPSSCRPGRATRLRIDLGAALDLLVGRLAERAVSVGLIASFVLSVVTAGVLGPLTVDSRAQVEQPLACESSRSAVGAQERHVCLLYLRHVAMDPSSCMYARTRSA